MMAMGDRVPSTAPRRLRELLGGMVDLPSDEDWPVVGLTVESRAVESGFAFLALRGTRRHGLEFIDEARDRGAAAVLWEPPAPQDFEAPTEMPCYAVPDLGERIGLIAHRFYGAPSAALPVIGVTGTDGKTSCSYFLAQVLDRPGSPAGLIGTLGAGLLRNLRPARHTTPDAVTVHRLLAEMREAGAGGAIMEVSSHGLDQGRVNGVAFATALLTNVSRDHLDYHGSEAAYREAKSRLFRVPGLHWAVLNADDGLGRELLASDRIPARRLAYGLAGADALPPADAHLLATDVQMHPEGLSMTVDGSYGRVALSTGLLGRFNAANLLGVLGVLLTLGLSLEEAAARLARVRHAPGRLERFGQGGAQPLVAVDYAHTPAALGAALATLREHCAGRLWCVFGCGGDRDRGKRPLMGAVAERLADRVILTDDNPRTEDPAAIIADILAGVAEREAFQVIRARRSAILAAISGANGQDVVLVAGKGHEDYQIVGERRLPFSDRDVVRELLATGSRP